MSRYDNYVKEQEARRPVVAADEELVRAERGDAYAQGRADMLEKVLAMVNKAWLAEEENGRFPRKESPEVLRFLLTKLRRLGKAKP